MPESLLTLARVVLALVMLGLGYTYVVYPALVHLLGRWVVRPVRRGSVEPTVTLIIAAYNEEKDIAAKLENTYELDYPRDRLEIVVASDGSTDRTHAIVEGHAERGVRLFVPDRHLGKTGTANACVPTTRGEILVFSDATGMYNPEALRALTANFADEHVGAVSGRVVYTYDDSVAAQGFRAYQRFVVPQRQAESRFGTETSVSGSIHAVRREVFRAAPADLSYDMVHPLHAAQAGLRTVYEAGAVSVEKARTDVTEEFLARVRLGVRAYSYVPYLLRGLLRCRDRLFVFQVVSHKLMRWLSPLLLAAGGVAAAILATAGGWWILPLAAGLAMAGGAGLGWLLGRLGRAPRLLAAPLFFATINLAFLLGFFRYLRGARLAGWTTER